MDIDLMKNVRTVAVIKTATVTIAVGLCIDSPHEFSLEITTRHVL